MDELILYFEIIDDGEPFYATINLGKQKKEIDYMEVAESVDKKKLLEKLCLDFIEPENVRVITKEEYIQNTEEDAENG